MTFIDDETISHQIIAARPGYATLCPLEGDGGIVESLWEEPIIAFLVTINRGSRASEWVGIYAITLDGISELAILKPDGKVMLQDVKDFESKEAYISGLNAERTKKPVA